MKPKTVILVCLIIIAAIAGIILWRLGYSGKPKAIPARRLETEEPSPVTPTAQPAPSVDRTEPLTSQPEGIPEGIFYTVQPGDTLSGIAKKFYNDARKYTILFEVNRDIIEVPAVIKPGWKIFIPRLEPEKPSEPSDTQKNHPDKPTPPSETPE